MATIQTQFNLIDRMSSPLMKINSVLELVVSQMQSVDKASNLGFNNSAINTTNECLVEVGNNLEKINNKAVSIKTDVNTTELASSISNVKNQIDSVNDSRISVSSNIQGVNEITGSMSKVKNQIESINNTQIEVSSKNTSMNNVTNELNKVQNSIDKINKSPIDITDDLNKNISTTNKFSTALTKVKSTISSISSNPIKFITNTSSLIKAKSLLKDIRGDLQNVDKEQKNWNNSISKGTSLFSKFSGLIGGLGVGYGIKTLGTAFISSAADLEATEAKFNTVFGEFTGHAQRIVDDFQKLTPATQASTRSMVSGIQDLLVPMGFARDEATGMTSKIMTLTGALTNFNSATHTAEDVASVFSSALVGEYDSLKALGVQLNVDSVKQRAVAMGLARTTSEVTTQHQALAMLEMAYEQSGDALAAYNEDSLDTISNMGILKAGFVDTFAEIGQSMLPKVNEFLVKIKEHMPTIERLLHSIAGGFIIALDVAIILFDKIMIGTEYMLDNWSSIAPLIMTVVSVYLVLNGVIKIYNTLEAISNGLKVIAALNSSRKAAAEMLAAGATLKHTILQHGLNAALLACPITWIILGIIAIIVVIYLVITAVNTLTGTTISATGVICGVISTAVAIIGNLFLLLWNLIVDSGVIVYNFIAMFANFLCNVWNDPINSTIRLFYNMFDVVLNTVQACASAIDMVFGSNLAGGLQKFRNTMKNGVDLLIGEEKIYVEYLNGDDFKLDRFEYGTAYQNGYDFGSNIEQTVTGVFDTSSLDSLDLSSIGDYTNDLQFPEVPDYSSLSDLENLEELNNAGSFPELPEEDLKYLKDIAERDVINRFTTAQVNVDLGGVTNNVNNNNDLDGFVDYLAKGVNEAMEKTANGVYV